MVEYAGLGKKSRKNSRELRRTRVVIGSLIVYHFVNPGLRTEIIFMKERTTENGGLILVC